MAQRIVRDREADGWLRSGLPIICKSCLGDNPYVRMTRADFDKECKICTRPFTPIRWQPGHDATFKTTEICNTCCCKLKNVCQVCLLDPVPVQARPGLVYGSSFGKMPPNDAILHLQRTIQDNKGKWPFVCSFYIMGECTRGENCPYRHVEMPETGDPPHQNITDGENDPGKAGEMEPPEDESIKTLYVSGINSRVLSQDLEGQLLSFEELDSFSIYGKKACVTFKTREAAEKVMQEPSNRLVVNGQRLKLTWAGPQVPKPDDLGASKQLQQGSVVAHSGLLPQAVISLQQNQHPPMHLPPPNQYQPFYFSMDPQRMGAAISTQELGGSRTCENDGASSSSSSSYLMPPHQPYPSLPDLCMPSPFQHGTQKLGG